jgi:ATP-binding cassette, subfamily B, bacterial
MANALTLRQVLPEAWQILKRVRPYLRKHRSLAMKSIVALLLATLLRLLEPWPLKFAFDYVIAPHAAPSVAYPLEPASLLLLSALAVVVITLLRALADFSKRIYFARLGNRVVTEMRGDLYERLQRLPMSFHDRSRNGDLVLRVVGDINMLRDATVTAVLPLLASVLILIGMWGVMLWLQWKLALLGMLTIPFLALRTTQLSRRIREAAQRQRRRQGAMAATASESLGAIKVLKTLLLEGAFSRHFATANAKSEQEDVKTTRLSAALERTVDVLLAVATALVLWYGAHLVLNQSLTPGDLLVFLAYLRKAFNPIEDFAKYTGRLAKAAAAGERVLDLMDRPAEGSDRPGAIPAPPFRGHVRFDRVGFSYEPGHMVLTDVDCEAHPGQWIAFVGPSGIGKSTMLNLLMRLYEPTEGKILIDGRDIREYTLASVRSQMGAVLQESILFAASVRENIGYGAPTATPDEIEAAARLANAHDFILALPQGYDTVLGERGATLSLGQRQRIAIARAALRKSPILILDEPTVGLDSQNRRDVVQALQRLARGRTTFLVTHELQLAAQADIIVQFDQGRVVECGTHEDLITLDRHYARTYQSQRGSFDEQCSEQTVTSTGERF